LDENFPAQVAATLGIWMNQHPNGVRARHPQVPTSPWKRRSDWLSERRFDIR